VQSRIGDRHVRPWVLGKLVDLKLVELVEGFAWHLKSAKGDFWRMSKLVSPSS
jgi:hypothetical protein